MSLIFPKQTTPETTVPTTIPNSDLSISPRGQSAAQSTDKPALLKQLQQLKATTRTKDSEIQKVKDLIAETDAPYSEYKSYLEQLNKKDVQIKNMQEEIKKCEEELPTFSPTAVVMTMIKDEENESQKLKKHKQDLEGEIHDFDVQLRNLRGNSTQASRFVVEQEHHDLCERLRKQNEIIFAKQKEVEELVRQVEGEEQAAIERSLELLRTNVDDSEERAREEREKWEKKEKVEMDLIEQQLALLKQEMDKLTEISDAKAKAEEEAKKRAATSSPTPLNTSPTVELLRFCPECGTKAQGKKFCMECGTSLIKKSATPAAAPPTPTPTPTSMPVVAMAPQLAPVVTPVTPVATPVFSIPTVETSPAPTVATTPTSMSSPAQKSNSPAKPALTIPKSPGSPSKPSPRGVSKVRPPLKKATYVKGEAVRITSQTKNPGVVAKAATFCKECGKRAGSGKFCLECGVVIPVVITCGGCGSKVTSDACTSCGLKVDATIQYTPVTVNWPYHSYQNTVQMYASFDEWQYPHTLTKKSTGQGWTATLLLPSNMKSFLCMFKISGTWFYDLGQPSQGDEFGIVRNYYEVVPQQQQ